MVRVISKALHRHHHLLLLQSRVREASTAATEGGVIISKTLSEILVCPLSKQPLRCRRVSQGGEESESLLLISGALGVSYPIVDGIPCLVPSDGKLLEIDETSKPQDSAFDH